MHINLFFTDMRHLCSSVIYTIIIKLMDLLTEVNIHLLQGFIQSGEVRIFGYARSNLSDDGLRERIRG